jgi:hypothetical protein
MDRPGIIGGPCLPDKLTYQAFLPDVVAFLIFFRGHIPACGVQALAVIPGDPFQGSERDIFDSAPRPFPIDELFLVKTVQ